MLVKVQQQPEKNPIFLIGSKERRYVEYPLLRIKGYDYGFSFNNSRALSLQYWNIFNNHNYMWVKRYDNQWSWLTAVFDASTNESHFYLNGSEIDTKGGFGSPSPHKWNGRLKNYGAEDWYIGTTPSEPDNSTIKYFKGDVAKVYAWKQALSPEEVSNLHEELPSDELFIDIDFNNPVTNFNEYNTETLTEDFKIPNSILPHRVEGKFECLPHIDEGIIDGKFAKGETTAKNERRYVLKMQQDQINYKQDGLKQVKYKLKSVDKLTPWAKMINIEL